MNQTNLAPLDLCERGEEYGVSPKYGLIKSSEKDGCNTTIATHYEQKYNIDKTSHNLGHAVGIPSACGLGCCLPFIFKKITKFF